MTYTKQMLLTMLDNVDYAINAIKTMRDTAPERCPSDKIVEIVAMYNSEIAALEKDRELVKRVISEVYGESETAQNQITLTAEEANRLYVIQHPYAES